MSHREPTDDLSEQASLYALGVLDPEEARRFEVHLAEGCQVCERELREFIAVVGHLGAAAIPQSPRPEARRRLLGAAVQPAPLVVRENESDWEPTDVSGMQVRRLVRDEAGRRVMLVGRLAMGTTVEAHRHAETEELYMIDGDLTVDGRRLERGDFCAMTGGRIHSSIRSEAGCTFLRLTVEPSEPAAPAATDPCESSLTVALAAEQTWQPSRAPGVATRRLFVDPVRATTTAIVRMDPGASLLRHRHLSTEQFYMLAGEARLDGEVVRAGDFYQAAAGTSHEVSWTEKGCTFLLIASRIDVPA